MTSPPRRERTGPPAPSRIHRYFIDAARRTGVSFLVGGAYALSHYTGIARDTKDLDIHVRVQDRDRILDRLSRLGLRVELAFPHWLAKAFRRSEFIDIIFNSGNGMCPVDDLWFEHAERATVLGRPVLLCPVEEMIWSKAYVQERERYDGADIAHLLLARGPRLRWAHLVRRFGPHWRVLLAHLIMFGFIYPGEHGRIPARLVRELVDRLVRELDRHHAGPPVCQGTLLSRAQYLVDVNAWGYRDARGWPSGPLSPDALVEWTAAYILDQRSRAPMAPRRPRPADAPTS
jgi:hypothetical protein